MNRLRSKAGHPDPPDSCAGNIAIVIRDIFVSSALPIGLVGMLALAVIDEGQRAQFTNVATNVVVFCIGGSVQRSSDRKDRHNPE